MTRRVLVASGHGTNVDRTASERFSAGWAEPFGSSSRPEPAIRPASWPTPCGWRLTTTAWPSTSTGARNVAFDRAYATRLHRLGDDVELLELAAADHLRVIDAPSPAWARVVEALEARIALQRAGGS